MPPPKKAAKKAAKKAPKEHLPLHEHDKHPKDLRRAGEHWQDGECAFSALAPIYESARTNAVKAYKIGNYFQALEFARTAHALAHLKNHGHLKLKSGESIARTGWKLAA